MASQNQKKLPEVSRYLDEIINSPGFADEMTEFLFRLCEIDTTSGPDISRMRENEGKIFCEIRRELASVKGNIAAYPITPDIEKHPAFSKLHFTKTQALPEGLDFSPTYEGRYNLVFRIFPDRKNVPEKGRNLAVNAHIDVVSPFFPPKIEKGMLFGRGACDDKASVVAMIKAAQTIDGLAGKGIVRLNKQAVLMFVIEEETGGNGSLSLAVNKELRKEYDSILLLECVENKVYPANRGAVWYKTELKTFQSSLAGAAAYIILEMEEEGAAIRRESGHPLFPDKPVQTCHGIIGKFGEHPSRICGYVSLELKNVAMSEKELRAIIDSAVEKYTAIYGDKTKVVDAETGKVKVERHYTISKLSGNSFRLEIFGSTGHMGSILENDCAITKMAFIVREILAGFKYGELPEIIIDGSQNIGALVMEGGQGFLPTHRMEDVMKRMASAADRGLKKYLLEFGRDDDALCATTYDKLHNSAFDGDPDSPSMRNALKALELCGLRNPQDSVTGLKVSCDARLFACEYPDLPVLTAGPGKLKDAHSDFENIKIADLIAAVRFLVLYILMETESLD